MRRWPSVKLAISPSRNPPARLTAKAMGIVADHAWPGNVRELRNAPEFALVLARGAECIEPPHLPDSLRSAGSLRADRSGWEAVTLEEMERRHVERTLHLAGGNRTLAAEKLGISRGRRCTPRSKRTG